MVSPDKTRRPGYAPAANAGVGRRGLHTRERILACAAEVFLANGFHGTSLDTIAKAANASRATVYQYFAGKEDIFGELSATAERAMLQHSARLGELGPTAAGVDALHRWLVDWADIYDTHAMVFAEFPGIGTATGLGVIDAGAVAETFRRTVIDRLQHLPLRALELDDAAAVLGRIPHMVNLYRHRAMFPLPDRAVVSRSLTVALQLMLFPETPDEALRTIVQPATRRPVVSLADGPEVEPAAAPLSPIVADVVAASSALFAERGYYDVGMEDIATSAGIGRATLYRYFSTKADILAELTRGAVTEIERQAAELERMPPDALSQWILEYVRFHRAYRGVIRAWFDGTVAEQLSDASVDHGIGALHHAVAGLLDSIALPVGIDREVAAAVFHAVLGRMTEPTGVEEPTSEKRAAELMVNLLRRSLLREL